MRGYVYIIQSADMAKDVGKIGRGKNIKRIKSYGSGAFIICIIYVEDMFETEARLKKVFKHNFQLVRGSEYFRGDITRMKKLFVSELKKCDFENNNTDEEDSLDDLDEMDSCEDSEDPKDPEESVPAKKIVKKQSKRNRFRPVFKCEKCGHEFENVFKLNRHLNRKTSCEPVIVENIDLDDPLVCKYCGRKYKYENTLNRHIQNSCKVFKRPNSKKQYIQKKKKEEEQKKDKYIKKLESEIKQLKKIDE